MNISLSDKQTPEDVARLASGLMDQLVTQAVPIGHGANSRVYQVTSSGRDYVMKFYFQHPADKRDRLGAEFKSLGFLWEHGIRNIPQPFSSWPQQSCALYAMVEGSMAKAITEKDIDTAAKFLKNLKGLKIVAGSQEFGAASEAYFSAKEIVAGVKTRLQRFGFHDSSVEYKELKQYLYENFNPLMEEVERWSKDYLSEAGILWDAPLSELHRTLSPSDFGFHNALRLADGNLCFLDFEYFGWDDPVKTTSDFLWHPAMTLTEDNKKQFVRSVQELFGDDSNFQTRLKALFPVFGLKWCLIFLNEFIAADAQRRDFARTSTKDKTTVRLEQLAKAKHRTKEIKAIYKEFPYGC